MDCRCSGHSVSEVDWLFQTRSVVESHSMLPDNRFMIFASVHTVLKFECLYMHQEV